MCLLSDRLCLVRSSYVGNGVIGEVTDRKKDVKIHGTMKKLPTVAGDVQSSFYPRLKNGLHSLLILR